MKTFKAISGCLLLVMIVLCVPVTGEAACDKQDEDRWVLMRESLPTANIPVLEDIINKLTALNAKCDPKTRFSASVVQLLIRATFEKDAMERLKKVQNEQSNIYDPGGMPGRY